MNEIGRLWDRKHGVGVGAKLVYGYGVRSGHLIFWRKYSD